jgi:hypothetical protein
LAPLPAHLLLHRYRQLNTDIWGSLIRVAVKMSLDKN